MDLLTWMEKAKKKIKIMDNGTTFVVKNLFNGVDWNGLGKGDKLKFGAYFKNEVIGQRIEGIYYIGKMANNSALYQKKR